MKYWSVRLLSVLLVFALVFGIQSVALHSNDYAQRLIVLAGLYVVLAVSLNIINGITGQFSLGHASFYQVGAYTAGYVSNTFFAKQPLPPIPWLIVTMFLGALAAGVAGLIVGLPSLRLRGDYLAIVTLGFAEIIRIIVQNQDSLGGAYGMKVRPEIPAIWLVWLLAFATIAIMRNLLKTHHGLAFLAVREDEIASSAMGVNVTRVKVLAFVLGAAFAGMAGALLAHFEGVVSPPTFDLNVSFIILTMVVLGGSGSITGSLVAALFLFYLPEYLRVLSDKGLIISGGSIVATALLVACAVGAARWVINRGRGTKWTRGAQYGGIVLGVIILSPLGGKLFDLFPALHAIQIPAVNLKMVIFAGTLIVLMLLRPQGIFGHWEFSWTWLQKRLGFQKSEVSV